jgi:putative hemin transport protein
MKIAAETESNLKEIWKNFQIENPKVRIRDAAKQIGVSEAELLATDIGHNVIRLNNDFAEILHDLHELGYLMALTRNEEIVHERKGVYENARTGLPHRMALFVNPDIDLRIFLGNWHFGFAVTSESPRGTMRSLQFFDLDGTAVHKVFLTDQSDLAAYGKLVEKYRDKAQDPHLDIKAKPAKVPDKSDTEIDVEGFRAAWAELKDTHDFFPLLRKFEVGREQALRLADKEMAVGVDPGSFKFILEEAARRQLPIMVFVGNAGIIQIHTGEVENVVEARGWFNVMDEKFNLHIDQTEIANAYVVKKPTVDGIVTSLELFNRTGENVALFFGKRKPGIPEKKEWRKLISELLAAQSTG